MSKTYKYIGNKLTQINMFVTVVIMWLIMSFLFEAHIEKKEMTYLQMQTSVMQAAFDLRHQSDSELRIKAALLTQTEPVTEKNIQELKSQSNKTHKAILKLLNRLTSLADNPKLFNFTRTTAEQIKIQIKGLDKLAINSKQSQTLTAKQLLLPIDQQDFHHENTLKSELNKTFNNIGHIWNSINFLPRKNANIIDKYQDLLSSNWSLLNLTASLDNELGQLMTGEARPEELNIYRIEALVNDISYEWLHLENVARPFSNDSDLSKETTQVKEIYYNSHDPLISQLHAQLGSGYAQYLTYDKWADSVENIRRHQRILTQKTLAGLEEINTAILTRANRNYIIDIVLLVISILACLFSFYSGRKLKEQAYTDPLTGLSNRLTFESKITSGEMYERQIAVYFDLDNFKTINENHGYLIGDEILKVVAERLKKAAGLDATVARLGGDEFAIYKKQLPSNFNCNSYVDKLLNSANNDIIINDAHIRLELSAGFAIAPDDCPAGLQLLKNADIALTSNKSRTRTAMMYRFDKSMGKLHDQRRSIENELKLALERDEFSLHYQPKVDPHTHTVRGVEALIRWNSAKLGNVFPDQFIPIAEDMGLLGEIGRWVLERSCKDIAGLHRQGLNGLGIAVNISAQQFADTRFSEKVSNALSESGLDAGYLELEVTESLVMHDIDWVTGVLADLRTKGVSIAIDDFGTGFSCLQHLQVLPLDTLKIDRAFIKNIAGSQLDDSLDETQDVSMVSSIIHLGELFGLKTVAEGIETNHQLKSLTNLGADLIQGYYFSKPVPLNELPAAITQIESSCRERVSEYNSILTSDSNSVVIENDTSETEINSDDADDEYLDRAA